MLLIPYKNADGVYYLYSPKDSEELFRIKEYGGFSRIVIFYVGKVILTPIALVMDIVLAPVEVAGYK